jgi:hypothetical protein
MPLFRRAALTCVVTTAPSHSTSTTFTSTNPIPQTHTIPTTPPPTRSSTRPPLTPTISWDTATFPETCNLLSPSPNGNWVTTTIHALKSPRATASSIHNALSWHNLHTQLANTADSTSDALQDSLNRTFEGRDLPAMHDKVTNLVPTITLPTMLQMSRSMDVISDSAINTFSRRTRSEAKFLDEELACDQFEFARHMGGKARSALVKQRICREWQVMSSRENAKWQGELDEALVRFFVAERVAFSVAQLFGMTPVWTGDVASKTWWLGLDTGLVEIMDEAGIDGCEERRSCLVVEFELPESIGSVRIANVEREVVDDGDWMAVEW